MKDADGAQEVIDNHLRWLLNAEKENLHEEQQLICETLSGFLSAYQGD